MNHVLEQLAVMLHQEEHLLAHSASKEVCREEALALLMAVLLLALEVLALVVLTLLALLVRLEAVGLANVCRQRSLTCIALLSELPEQWCL